MHWSVGSDRPRTARIDIECRVVPRFRESPATGRVSTPSHRVEGDPDRPRGLDVTSLQQRTGNRARRCFDVG